MYRQSQSTSSTIDKRKEHSGLTFAAHLKAQIQIESPPRRHFNHIKGAFKCEQQFRGRKIGALKTPLIMTRINEARILALTPAEWEPLTKQKESFDTSAAYESVLADPADVTPDFLEAGYMLY